MQVKFICLFKKFVLILIEFIYLNKMREILFKAKRVQDNQWVEGLYSIIECKFGLAYSITEKCNSKPLKIHIINPKTLCQYTGIKDNNGIKVFENDIIAWGERNLNIIEWGSKRKGFVIKYEYIDYEINDKKYYKTKYYNIGNSKDIEVVGNIYETKKDSV